MATLLDSEGQAAILDRLGRVTPEHRAKWGRFTAHQMLCHVGDQLAVSTGDIRCAAQDTWLYRLIGKWLVIRSPLKPAPGKIQTAPEMLSTSPSDWSADLARCRELVTRVGSGGGKGVHPAFGALSPRDWARLGWKHLDHHLRQFGE